VSNCLVAWTMDGRIMSCGIVSSRQSDCKALLGFLYSVDGAVPISRHLLLHFVMVYLLCMAGREAVVEAGAQPGLEAGHVTSLTWRKNCEGHSDSSVREWSRVELRRVRHVMFFCFVIFFNIHIYIYTEFYSFSFPVKNRNLTHLNLEKSVKQN